MNLDPQYIFPSGIKLSELIERAEKQQGTIWLKLNEDGTLSEKKPPIIDEVKEEASGEAK